MSNIITTTNDKSFIINTNGRLCLVGEHCDWISSMFSNDYIMIPSTYALTSAINLGIIAKVDYKITDKKDDDNTIGNIIVVNEYKKPIINIKSIEELDNIIKTRNPDNLYVASSIKTVLLNILENPISSYKKKVSIMIEIIKNTLPRNKGLSSSAAICSLICYSVLKSYCESISSEEEIENSAKKYAKMAENAIGSNCGSLDHLCMFQPEGFRIFSFEYDKSNRISDIIHHKPLDFILITNNNKKRTPEILENLQLYTKTIFGKDNYIIPRNNFTHHFINYNRTAVITLREDMKNNNYKMIGNSLTLYQLSYHTMINTASKVATYYRIKDKSDKTLDLSIAMDKNFDKLFMHNTRFKTEMSSYIYGYKGVGSHGDNSYLLLINPEFEESIRTLIDEYELGDCTSFSIDPDRKDR